VLFFYARSLSTAKVHRKEMKLFYLWKMHYDFDPPLNLAYVTLMYFCAVQVLCLSPTFELAIQIGEVASKMSQFDPDIKIR